MAELAGKDTVIKISGAATTMTTEATTAAGNQIYQITNAVKQVLDRDTPPTVYDDGVQTVEAYTVNYLNGKVTFATADAGRGPITVTGKYLPMTVAAYAHTMRRSQVADLLDKTVFGDTYKKRKKGLLSASGTFSHFDVADTVYGAALAAGVPVVIEDRDASASEPNRFWALLNSEEVTAAVTGMQNVTVSWESYDAWIKLGG